MIETQVEFRGLKSSFVIQQVMPLSKVRAGRRFVVRRSGIHGRGVFALCDIPKGERLMEYVGERISHQEADRRYAVEHEYSPHTMLFAVDDKTVIDATRWGNSSRFINHSCSPNCEADEENGRIFISARKNIPAGAELTYDYNLILEERHTPAVKRAHACFCGMRGCRGTLLGSKR
ncbi:MAG TPA: SET domain-containing protein-lysine N-methyltransferase [Burkholderiales bacterium]|nr:SET domain-containing protein-lysine N-methyltransferase [Burkholderiales bacterium]